MRIVVHPRSLGRIHETADVFHETVFYCLTILSLPIVPRATFRFTPGGPSNGERIPMSTRSVIRAYLTTWGFVLAFAMVFAGPRLILGNIAPGSRGGAIAALLSVAGVEIAGFALGFAAITSLFWLGARRGARFGKIAGWLTASFGLFVVQAVIAAFGVKGIFG